MKAIVQRVTRARVTVASRVTGEIGAGLVVLLGVHRDDTADDLEWICGKLTRLRIFDDATGAMNLSVLETGGGLLVVSQFTLLGSTKKGNRPSWNDAARPEQAIPLYERALARLAEITGRPVACGEFGAMMQLELVNDGPVTLTLDSRARE